MAYTFNPENITRIDYDGKVKIPDSLRIRRGLNCGDKVQWTVEGHNLKISKFHHLNQFKDAAQSVANAVGKLLELSVFVCNEDEIVAASRVDDSYVGRYIGASVLSSNIYDCTQHEEPIYPIRGSSTRKARFIQPIVCNDDIIGAIVVLAPHNFIKGAEDFSTQTAMKLLDWCAEYLSNKAKELNI